MRLVCRWAPFAVRVLVDPHPGPAIVLRSVTEAVCAADDTSRARQPHATGGCLRLGMGPAGSVAAT